MDMQNINKKIAIIGCSGSGKSTLATKLGDVLKLNVVHLDAHFWHPGWVPTPEDKWIEITEKLRAYAEGRHIITLSSPADVTRFLEDARRSGVLDAWYQNAM